MKRHRRRVEDDGPSHERWLVSYADFITLLFAFFVVMYAISTVNEGKYRVVSDALTNAFRHERIARQPDSPTTAARVLTPTPRSAARNGEVVKRQREQRLMGLAGKISDALRPLVQTGEVRLTHTTRGLAVEISASVLFSPGQATLQPDSVSALSSVAAVLGNVGVSRASLAYTYASVDKDATVAAFNTDDFFWGTGWEGHRLDLATGTVKSSSIHGIAQRQRFKDSPDPVLAEQWVTRYRLEWRTTF